MFLRTDEVKKDAVKMTLPVFLETHQGTTSKEALTRAYHDIRGRYCGNYTSSGPKVLDIKVPPAPSKEEQLVIDNPISDFKEEVKPDTKVEKPKAEQPKVVVEEKIVEEILTSQSQSESLSQATTATEPTVTSEKGKPKSVRLTELAQAGKSLKEAMTIMKEEENPVQYSQAHQIFKKLGLK